MNRTSFLTPLATLALAALASAQSYTETFDGGSNAGGWTFGNGFDAIETTGGNPGAYLHNHNIDTFAPQPSTTLVGNAYTGDWRARGVSSFGIDLITHSTQFPALRECTLMLSDGTGCNVYFLGTDFVPQPGTGWKSFFFPIDAGSATIPAGWFPGGSCTNGDAAWNQVIQNVQQVTIFYGDPTFFYIFDVWDIGMDNVEIVEGTSNYCSSTANSTGGASTISTTGSTSIVAEDLTLVADNVPAGQPGLFYYGQNQIDLAFGNGRRCVGDGGLGLARLPVSVASAANVLSHAIDYDLPPSIGTQITAGSTWNFQAWFRDPAGGGAFFDLSDAIELTFAP